MPLAKTGTGPHPSKAEPSTTEGTATTSTNLCWNGKPLSDTALDLVLLLWANRSPELPAFILLRPEFDCYRWTESGEIYFEYHAVFPKYKRLFSVESHDGLSLLARTSKHTLLPCDSFAWLGDDFYPRPSSVCPGDEMERLISESALVVNVRHDLVYLGLSQQLREDVSQMSMRALRDARLELVLLVILSLPHPYTEPLWEMALLRCRDVIKSTVVPFLLSADIEELNSLYLIIISRRVSLFRSYWFLLPFNLVRLGFKIHLIDWKSLFDWFFCPSPHFVETLILISEVPNVMNWPDVVTQLTSLRKSNFFWSLIGFSIARTRKTSTDPSYLVWHDRISAFWLEQDQPSGSTVEKAARSLVAAKEQTEDFLKGVHPEVQCSLGVAFNAMGYPDTGCALLERYLRVFDSVRSVTHMSTRSVVYGHLFAELVNNRNALHDGKRLISWGLDVLRLRDGAKLGARLDSINIKLAVADAHITLADYDTAIDLLHQVLSLHNLESYIHIVSTLRLNKIGRRINRFESHVGGYLKAASLLIVEEGVEVQKEFLAELAATLGHVKHIEVDNPYHSDLCETVHKTIDSYENHHVFQDDWRLQNIKSMMGKMLPVGVEVPS